MYQGLFQIQEILYNSFYGSYSSLRLQIQCIYNVSSSVPFDGLSQTSSTFDAVVGVGVSWEFDGLVNAAKSASASRLSKAQAQEIRILSLLSVNQVKDSFAKWKIGTTNYLNNRYLVKQVKDLLPSLSSLSEGKQIDATQFVVLANQYRAVNEQYSGAIFNANLGIAGLYRYTSTWPDELPKMIEKRLMQLD